MPHVFGAAPTGRSKCRGCGEPIAKGEVRFGESLPNPYAEGEITHWFHPLCAAYTRACLDSIARRLSKGELKMSGWLDEVRVRVVSDAELCVFGNPDALLANVNTPDDFLGLEAHQGHKL